MTIPAKLDLGEHYSGDTWDGLGPITIQRNGLPLDLTGAAAEMRFRRSSATGSSLTLSSVAIAPATPAITITQVSSIWQILVLPRVLVMEPEIHYWDLKLTLQAGTIKTILAGTISIKEDI